MEKSKGTVSPRGEHCSHLQINQLCFPQGYTQLRIILCDWENTGRFSASKSHLEIATRLTEETRITFFLLSP